MRHVLLPSLFIAASLALGPALTPIALAQDLPGQSFSTGPVVEMLPTGTIVGDGETTIALHITAIGPDGAPSPNANKWKLSTSAGKLDGPTNLDNGVLEFQFTPPAVEKTTLVEFRLKGRAASGAVEKAWGINVIDPGPSSLGITANPARIVLGQDESASLAIRFNGPLGAQESNAKVRALASTGTITNPTYLGNGQFTARYEPPPVNFPQLAILTFVDARSPEKVLGYQALPLVGKAGFPVKVEPGATVLLRIDKQEYGPVIADASGRASVPITVVPGVAKATLVTAIAGRTSEQEIDLQVPETSRIAMFPTHAGVPSDGRTQVPVRAVVLTPTGGPDVNASVTFSTTAGTVTAATHEGNGVYRALFTPAANGNPSTATISASLTKQDGQTAISEVHLVPPRAANIKLIAEPEKLTDSTKAFKIFAKVTDASGQGLTGQQLLLTSSNASVSGDVRDLKGGDYQVTFSTSGNNSVAVGATVAVAPAGNTLQHLVVLSDEGRIASSGTATMTLTVISLDAFGHPVPNVPVTLRLLAGKGSLPSHVKTDAGGLAQVRYTAGRKSGIVTILAQSEDITGGTSLIQAPSTVAPALTLPRSGSAAARSMAKDWSGVVAELTVPRAGAPVTATSTVTESADPGELDTYVLSSQPASAAAGGTVVLRIEGQDSAGRSVVTDRPEVLVTQGTLGPVQDLGGGAWQAALTLSNEAVADTKVVVTDPQGAVIKLMTIPTVASAGSAWTGPELAENTWGTTTTSSSTTPEAPAETEEATEPAAEEEPAAEPSAEEEPVAEAAPSESGTRSTAALSTSSDAPWLRVKAGWVGGSYTYAQTPENVENNPLWDKPVSLGGDAGLTWQNGFHVDVAAWGDALPVTFGQFIGVEAEGRLAAYRVSWPGSSAIITDWVPQIRVNAMGRYVFSAGVGDFYAAAKIGLLYGDFVTYLNGDDEGTIEFGPLGLPGLGLGAEVGADLMEGDLHFQASLLQGLRGPLPYSTNVDLEVSYRVWQDLFVHAGYGLTSQSIPVLTSASTEKVGTLSDRSSLMIVGVGYQR